MGVPWGPVPTARGWAQATVQGRAPPAASLTSAAPTHRDCHLTGWGTSLMKSDQ